jgi:hypothetical protein
LSSTDQIVSICSGAKKCLFEEVAVVCGQALLRE